MKVLFKVLSVGLLVLMLVGSNSFAIPLGMNITIYDGAGSGTGWFGANEDNEVEPQTTWGQGWDLEGFFFQGSTLTIVSGYNMRDGIESGGTTYTHGDLFIDINSDLSDGYTYVYDLNFDDLTYTIWSGNYSTLPVVFGQNSLSNPWLRDTGGTQVTTGSFQYWTGLSDSDVGGLSGAGIPQSHYAAAFDLSQLGLPSGTEISTHFTYKCGNDNLLGKTHLSDAANTVFLFGFALCGVELLRRKLQPVTRK